MSEYPKKYTIIDTDWNYVTYHLERDHIPIINAIQRLEHTLGLEINGNQLTLADRLLKSINKDGYIFTNEMSLKFNTILPPLPPEGSIKLFVNENGDLKILDSAGNIKDVGSSLDFKSSCRVISLANLDATYNGNTKTLVSTTNQRLIIDGVMVNLNDRILVAGQTDKRRNGIYEVVNVGSSTEPWVLRRSEDCNVSFKISAGMYVYIEEGEEHGDEGWVLKTDNPIILDETELEFVRFGPGTMTHSNLKSLGSDDHLQYALLAGRSGGQILIGGINDNENLVLQSTTSNVRGWVIVNDKLSCPELRIFGNINFLSNDDVVIQTLNNKSLIFGTNNNGHVIITSDGKVGIGTMSPGFALDVQSGWVKIGNGPSAIQHESHPNFHRIAFYNLRFWDWNLDTDFISFKNGKLGIFVLEPLYSLDINGNLRISQEIVSTVNTGNAPFIITSTTLVNNLNSDLLDGYHATDFEFAQVKGNLTANSPLMLTSIRQVIGGDTTLSLSYNPLNLRVTNNSLDTIQDIHSNASPSFRSISLTENAVPNKVLMCKDDNGLAEWDFLKAQTPNTIFVASSEASPFVKSQCHYVCDGTDDQIEIQNAINELEETGGTVYLSNGTFYFTSSIYLHSNIKLIGHTNTTFLVVDTGNNNFYYFIENTVGKNNITVENIKFDGNNIFIYNPQENRYVYSGGMYFRNCQNLKFSNCITERLSFHPIRCEICENIIVTKCQFLSRNPDALWYTGLAIRNGSRNSYISNCKFYNMGYAISWSNQEMIFENNEIYNDFSYVILIYCFSNYNVKLLNNKIITRNTRLPFYIRNCSNLIFSNNYIEVENSPGLWLSWDTDNIIVENNTIINVGNDYKYVGLGNGMERIIFKNNIVSNFSVGIASRGSSIASNNIVKNCIVGYMGSNDAMIINNICFDSQIPFLFKGKCIMLQNYNYPAPVLNMPIMDINGSFFESNISNIKLIKSYSEDWWDYNMVINNNNSLYLSTWSYSQHFFHIYSFNDNIIDFIFGNGWSGFCSINKIYLCPLDENYLFNPNGIQSYEFSNVNFTSISMSRSEWNNDENREYLYILVGNNGYLYLCKYRDASTNWNFQFSPVESLGEKNWTKVMTTIHKFPATLVACADDGTIAYSHDGGDTWNTYVVDPGIWNGIALSNDGQRIFLSYGNNTIIYTLDGGITWNTQTIGTNHIDIAHAEVYDQLYVACTNGEIYHTSDYQNWSLATTFPGTITKFALSRTRNNLIMVVDDNNRLFLRRQNIEPVPILSNYILLESPKNGSWWKGYLNEQGVLITEEIPR